MEDEKLAKPKTTPADTDMNTSADKPEVEAEQKASKNPGNFANNPERARAAGRKGGKNSGGNFKNNPKRASEAGRKGGKN